MSAIRIQDLIFRWAPTEPVVLDIPAFDVGDGELVFLAGPSGSGKTTLLNLIGGLAAPCGGSVAVLGEPMSGLPATARDRLRAEKIGFVFQIFNLVPCLSVMENIRLACMFSPARRRHAEARGGQTGEAAALLERLGLPPEDFQARPAAGLSIGQQQRVAVARALIGGPGLIIADEPTSALDTANRRGFLDLLTEVCRQNGASLLFASHDEDLAARFDRRVDLTDLNRVRAAGSAGA